MNLIKNYQPDIDKIYFCVKNHLKRKYQLVINGRKKKRIKKLRNPKIFIDYSQINGYVFEDLEDYNRTKKIKVLIAFDHMIAYMKVNKRFPYRHLVLLKKKENS